MKAGVLRWSLGDVAQLTVHTPVLSGPHRPTHRHKEEVVLDPWCSKLWLQGALPLSDIFCGSPTYQTAKTLLHLLKHGDVLVSIQ